MSGNGAATGTIARRIDRGPASLSILKDQPEAMTPCVRFSPNGASAAAHSCATTATAVDIAPVPAMAVHPIQECHMSVSDVLSLQIDVGGMAPVFAFEST